MNSIEDLIIKIQVAQVASEGYAKELSNIKEKKEEVDQLIEESKAELLKLITSDEAIKVDNLVAQRFHRENTGYTDEKKLIEFLKSNISKYLPTLKVSLPLTNNNKIGNEKILYSAAISLFSTALISRNFTSL